MFFLAALGCTKFVFGRGSAPDPAGGAYSAPPDPLSGLKGTTSKGEGKGKGQGKGKGIGEDEREEEEKGRYRPFRKFLAPPLNFV